MINQYTIPNRPKDLRSTEVGPLNLARSRRAARIVVSQCILGWVVFERNEFDTENAKSKQFSQFQNTQLLSLLKFGATPTLLGSTTISGPN